MTYTFNPICPCPWCTQGGTIPTGTPNNGHSFGYDTPHIPPHAGHWPKELTRPATTSFLEHAA